VFVLSGLGLKRHVGSEKKGGWN